MGWLSSFFGRKKEFNRKKDGRIKILEGIIGIEIDNPALFQKALRHRSSLSHEQYESYDSYERLEFLGDAVLDLIIAEILFRKFPEKDEGFLTKIRAKLVKGTQLTLYTDSLGLSNLLELGEEKSPDEISKNILADVFESIIAAIYVTKGYEAAFNFVEKVVIQNIDFDELIHTLDNYKSALLEYSQAHKFPLPVYKVVNETGPGHQKIFTISVFVDGKDMGTGVGPSKKLAEQEAAKEALRNI